MKRMIAALAFSLLATSLPATDALAGPDPRAWTPTSDQIARLEAQVSLPNGAGDLHAASRAYEGLVQKDRPVIFGQYTMAGPPGVTIVQPGQVFPTVMDGGCRYVMVWYDVATETVTHVACNGVA